MDIIFLMIRLVLFIVFATAGFTKLADLSGSRQAVHDFGIPSTLAGPLGLILPFVELVIALALVPVATMWWGAIGSLTLLLLFLIAISINLARGRKPDCHCFGQLHSTPISWQTVVRNSVLAILAGFVIWQGPDRVGISILGWLSLLIRIEILGLLAIIVILGLLTLEGWFLLHLLRQNGRLLLRIEILEKGFNSQGMPIAPSPTISNTGLPIGTPAPTFQLPGLSGKTLTLDALCSAGKPLLLIFSDPDCGPCNALMPEIAGWQQGYASKLVIALFSRGTLEANHAKSSKYGLENVILQQDCEIAQAYRAHGTPSAVLVHPDGTIGSPPVGGAAAIRSLVIQTVKVPTLIQPTIALPLTTGECDCSNKNGHTLTQSLPIITRIGKPAPKLKLPDLNGQILELADFRDRETLVIFWNPSCGYCNKMLNDLRVWEASPPQGAPQLLIVSTGTVDANRAMGLYSPIVLDQNFNVGRTFGVNGTPSAVLVDVKGNIASDIAVSASAVFALAKITKPDE